MREVLIEDKPVLRRQSKGKVIDAHSWNKPPREFHLFDWVMIGGFIVWLTLILWLAMKWV